MDPWNHLKLGYAIVRKFTNVTSNITFLFTRQMNFTFQMTSVERVMEYTHLEQENEPNDKTVAVPENWPKYGIITAEGLYYAHHPTLPYVLRKMNFCIRAEEKVTWTFLVTVQLTLTITLL